ncbi:MULTISPECIES: alpha/beta fold hydrolase [unclassified Pseudomonas]|uniref:thioesterase II family protein n=1 Tax=unclassified Pseudomonas TaxID=196821 RepID=UPI00244CF506|nr:MULTISPECIES: alpha/beta fold hydrolase [unclassified Pseudomonas]MDH0896154.1 alpha/beta fold hydrolase [Pseudomonas sp. GD03875]MDH1067744.1 alpha/beta fold hydrolase [Pseudomonas sp. GD03985]
MSKLNLFCLPYSGASAMVYSRWRRSLPDWLEVRPVELPGRGARLGEPLQTDMHALARQLAGELAPRLGQPYALFGHSLGALLAFEIAHALRDRGCSAPLALLASGTAAPTRREDYEKDYSQPKSDVELVAELRDLQGTPEEVLANEELMGLTLPILRADFLMCGRYQYRQRPRLELPIHVLGGKEDKSSMEQLLAWQDETATGFSLDMIAGGHFFIHEHESRVLKLIRSNLSVHLRRIQPRSAMVAGVWG